MNDLYFKIKSLINKGSLKFGDKLPSIRKASAEEGLAANTIWSVYKKLVDEDYVTSSKRSGYTIKYNKNAFLEKPILYVLNKKNITNNHDQLYREITKTLKTELAKINCHLEVYILNQADEKFLLEHLNSNEYSGLIVDSVNLSIINKFQKLNLPIILIDEPLNNLSITSVVQANFLGSSKAAQILIQNNPKELVWLGIKRGHGHSEMRYAGANSTLTLQNRKFDYELFLELEDPTNYNKIKNILDKAQRPTGVCSLWKSPTILLFDYCKKNKIDVGKDFFITAWCCQEIYQSTLKKHIDPKWKINFITWSIKDLTTIAIKTILELNKNNLQTNAEQTLPIYIKTLEEMNILD